MSDSILNKVRKLLALSGSPNEHEAQAALAMAQRLMIENNLSMEAVERFESNQDEYIKESHVWGTPRGPRSKDYILVIIQKYFFVKVVHDPNIKGVWIFGEKDNVAVAMHVLNVLIDQFEHLWVRYRIANCAGIRDQQPYYYGLQIGFSRKLDEERKVTLAQLPDRPTGAMSGMAIVHLKDEKLLAEYKKAFTGLVKRQGSARRHTSSTEAGIRDGKNININKPVGHSRKGLPGR